MVFLIVPRIVNTIYVYTNGYVAIIALQEYH